MRIRRIELDAFGRLEDFSEELAEGLHIFLGPNEAGKSTLQQAILALLYGFYEADRSRPAERAAHDRYTPWNGGSYRGRLEYELGNGRRFRVDRDFTNRDVETHVYDLSAGGRDVTDDYGRGRHGNLTLARKHLGMPKAVFEACAFVSQGELFEVQEKAGDISDTIISLADSATRDVSAQRALDRLEKVYKEGVGSPRARTTPLPVAQRDLEKLEQELMEIDAVRGQIAEDASARDKALVHESQLQSELRRARYLLSVVRAQEARQVLSQLDDLARREEEARAIIREHEAYARFPVEERDAVQGESARIQQMEERLTSERNAMGENRRRVEELAAERESVAREQRELAHLRDFPISQRSEVDRLALEWRSARTRASDTRTSLDAVSHVGDKITEYESLGVRVGSFTDADVRSLYQRLSAGKPSGLLASIKQILRAIVRLILRFFRSHEISDGKQPEENISREEAERLLAQRERWNSLRPEVERYQSARVAAESSEEALRSAEDALREALLGAVDDISDLERACQIFGERCNGAARLQEIERQIAMIDKDIESQSSAVRRFEQDEQTAQSRITALVNKLRELTGREGSLDELLAAFEEGCQRKHKHDEAVRTLESTREQRGVLLRGRSPDEIRRQLEESEADAARITAEEPSLEGATTHEPLRELSIRTDQIEENLNVVRLSVRGLTAKIETELGNLRPRAHVEEEIELTRRKVKNLEQFRAELETAMEMISEAAEEAHRDFGPHVGRFLSDHMARVTAGRYRTVHLDPTTLELRFETPERRRLEEISVLSRGTRAAAYLLLRVGLAQHMSSIHEPIPLILDDPLVDLDDARMEQFLLLLLDLASEVQVLLFTKDEGIRTWFEQHHKEGSPHKLTPLEAPLLQPDPDAPSIPEPLRLRARDES